MRLAPSGVERGLIRWPSRSGWLLEAPGDGRPRGMAVTSGATPAIQNPAYRPAGVSLSPVAAARRYDSNKVGAAGNSLLIDFERQSRMTLRFTKGRIPHAAHD